MEIIQINRNRSDQQNHDSYETALIRARSASELLQRATDSFVVREDRVHLPRHNIERLNDAIREGWNHLKEALAAMMPAVLLNGEAIGEYRIDGDDEEDDDDEMEPEEGDEDVVHVPRINGNMNGNAHGANGINNMVQVNGNGGNRLQLQYLMMINSQASNGMMSPPSTISSPLNTPHPFVAQSLTDASEPNYSPAPTDDFEGANFKFNVSSRINSANGYYKNDGYERGAMYTAEDVHVVVKNHRDGNKQRVVSNNVFVGGISHSMNREIINTFFGKFGTVFVDWPVKQKCNARGKPVPMTSYSYLFLVYSEEQSVIKLMKECQQSGNDFFVVVPGCQEAIQIRPWFIKNAFYISNKARNTLCIDIHRTVFVGGLPRIVTAEEIAQIFSEFGKVLLVTIDIDQDYAYPKGAARVTFERDSSFSRALERKYLKFKNIDSSKTLIEIKPYVMEDVGCDQCGGLWFNPFLDVYDQLKSCKSKQNQRDNTSINSWASKKKTVDSESQFLDPEDLFSKIDAGYQRSLNSSKNSTSQDALHDFGSENEVETGARKFLAMTKSFGLDQEQTVNVLGKEYNLGPSLWYQFLPLPSFECGNESVQMIDLLFPTMDESGKNRNRNKFIEDSSYIGMSSLSL